MVNQHTRAGFGLVISILNTKQKNDNQKQKQEFKPDMFKKESEEVNIYKLIRMQNSMSKWPNNESIKI